MYAASSNQTALDALPNQRSMNGLFTGELLAAMRGSSSLEIRDLAQKVRYSVMEKARAVGHVQVPALYENLGPGTFYFSALVQGPGSTSVGSPLPQRIKIIVPFAEQGPSDSVVRIMAPLLAKALNREIIIENQLDPPGDRVAEVVGNSPADGSVLLVSGYVQSARRLRAGIGRLRPLGIFADTPLSVAVNIRNEAKNLSELLTATKAARRRLRMAVGIRGSASEMCGQQLQNKFGGDLIELVPMNGDAPGMVAVSEGNADLICSSTISIRATASRANTRIREIAEVRSTASPFARKPQVGTSGTQGFDIVAPNWLGLFAPAGLSADLTRELSAAIARLQRDPAYVQAIARLHALPVSAEQATPEGLLRDLRLSLSLQK
jgi:tripartite-type tricarboxylate transporter receptor subunit TctC